MLCLLWLILNTPQQTKLHLRDVFKETHFKLDKHKGRFAVFVCLSLCAELIYINCVHLKVNE